MKRRLASILFGMAWFLLLCAVGFLGANTGLAQETTAGLGGTVTDQTKAVVSGAKITLLNVGTGWQRATTTNNEGYYAFPLLPPGQYTLTAEMPGFARVTVNDIVMEVSINSTVNILLEPGTVTESVLVKATSNQIDLTGATRTVSVTNEQVSNIPVFSSSTGRNVLSFLPFLVPGVIPTETMGGITTSSSSSRGEGLSINGGRTISISYNFEGGDNNDGERNTAASVFPNPDALQEFTVVANNYQADLGRSSGGVINAVAKKGTNDFHGNLRYFLLNEALDARSFFDAETPRSRLNTFGGQIGGPVVRDRTHFFFDYEGARADSTQQFLAFVPTIEERSGDFSALPSFLWPIDPLTGTPFPGGIIPQNRFAAVSVAMLDLIPMPNEGTRFFRQDLIAERDNNQFTIRGEHQFSSADSLSVTYFFNQADTVATDLAFPVDSSSTGRNRGQNLVLRESHVFSPRAVNQFTATINRRTDGSVPNFGSADGMAPSDFGFQTRPQTDNFLGPPLTLMASVFPQIGTFVVPTTSSRTTWQVKDDFSFARANHSFKFGGDVREFLLNSTRGNDNGRFLFFGINPFGTFNDLGNFLLGIPDGYSQTTGNTIWPRQNAYSLYIMDEWRVRPNLTFNVGLRYELVPPMRDKQDQVSVFRPGVQSQLFPTAPAGILFVGDPDPILGTVPRAGYPTDKNNFAPRISLAYSPQPQSGFLRALFGEGRTAIRAGGGVFYDQTYGRNFTQFQFVEPFSTRENLSLFDIAFSGGTFANPFGSLPNNWPLDLGERSFTSSPAAVQPFDPTFRTAYTYQYNLTIQRELPGSLLFEIAYVGSSSFKLNRERELNLGQLVAGSTPTNLRQRRLDSNLGTVASQESSGRGRYDSLQVRLVRKFAGGLSFDGSYVYGKSLDDGSAPLGGGIEFHSGPGSAFTYPLLWARSLYDRRHSFVASYTYAFPTTGRGGAIGRLLNGWQIGGITQLRTGLPMDIRQSIDSTLTGEANSGRPDLVGTYQRLNPRQEQPNGDHLFFDPSVFQKFVPVDETEARRGTLPRNVFDGPGQNMTNLSIIKRTTLAESHVIELRADINNFFNHANFFTPGTNVDFSGFGEVTDAGPGRRIQLSLRYAF